MNEVILKAQAVSNPLGYSLSFNEKKELSEETEYSKKEEEKIEIEIELKKNSKLDVTIVPM